MNVSLSHNAYGKHAVRVSKIKRPRQQAASTEVHEFMEVAVDVELQGDFAATYSKGDNSQIVATDTIKNTVHALAKDDAMESIESFGIALAEHFLRQYGHVVLASIVLRERRWTRLLDCPHAFVGTDCETPTATIVRQRNARNVVKAGIENLEIAKTTQSGFEGFHSDEYRTLKDTSDRIMATELQTEWIFADQADIDFTASRNAIREAMLKRFVDHFSRSVQETLMLMGQAALDACPAVTSITLTMPNKHHLLIDLESLGRENDNEVFVATDEPFGWITGTLSRDK
jgi:urate oxidase